ncbi:hypothetical protein TELCIR_08975, partial [Teladorsagia circumcincta]
MDALFQYVFNHYAWLIDSYMINYFTLDLWSALPSSWQSAFENAESPAASAVILVGCCYHKLSVHHGEGIAEICDKSSTPVSGFPLSSKYGSIELSYAARDLACHGNERFAEQLLERPRDKFRIQCFRAAVEWVIAHHKDHEIRRQRSALVLSSVATEEGMTFEEYVEHALTRHPEIAEAVNEQPRDKFRIQCFRAAVEWVIANHKDHEIRRQRSALVLSSVASTEGMTFEEYVEHALTRHPEIAEAVNEQVRCDERVRRFVDHVEYEWRRFL